MSIARLLTRMRAQRAIADVSVPHAGAALDALLAARRAAGGLPVSAYAGFDPTGPSLHVGHLAVVCVLAKLQRAGIRPVALVGGATALIGDPSGKSADRPLLSAEEVDRNVAGIQRSLSSVLHFDAPGTASTSSSSSSSSTSALCVNNADFYRGMDVFAFMRSVGRHFRISSMLAKDTVKSRLDGGTGEGATGMSFTEFSYPLFQAWDFWHLHTHHGVVMQVGGRDQWGNISAGLDFVHRMHESCGSSGSTGSAPSTTGAGADAAAAPAAGDAAGRVFGVTVPLVTTAGGKKLGKSEGNAVWLNGDLTSHHAFYQYLFNRTDEDALALLPLLSLEHDAEGSVEALAAEHAAKPEARLAQRALADAATLMVRGREGLDSAYSCARLLFGHTGAWGEPVPPSKWRADDIAALVAAGDLASVTLPASAVVGAGSSVVGLAVAAGLCPSKSEARRMLSSGGLYANHRRIEVPKGQHDVKLEAGDAIGGRFVVLGQGKKKQAVVVIAPEDASSSASSPPLS